MFSVLLCLVHAKAALPNSIHTNVLHRSFIKYLPEDGPERAHVGDYNST